MYKMNNSNTSDIKVLSDMNTVLTSRIISIKKDLASAKRLSELQLLYTNTLSEYNFYKNLYNIINLDLDCAITDENVSINELSYSLLIVIQETLGDISENCRNIQESVGEWPG